MPTQDNDRGLLKLAGGLLLGGFLALFVVTTAFHPSHDENNHPVIFGKYDQSDAWVTVHFGQFAAVMIALAGFVVLHHVLEARGRTPILARLAIASTIATAAVWAVLQAIDGVALKEATEAWAAASAPEKAARFGDAEAVRWAEWGLQSYFRLLLGATFILFGTAAARAGVVNRAIAGVAILAGSAYAGIGVAVGHSGLDKPGGPIVYLLMLTFVIGILAAGARRREAGGQLVPA